MLKAVTPIVFYYNKRYTCYVKEVDVSVHIIKKTIAEPYHEILS